MERNKKGMMILLFVSIFLYIFGAEMYEFINVIVSAALDGNFGDYAPFTFGSGLTSLLTIVIIVVAYLIYTPFMWKDKLSAKLYEKLPFLKDKNSDTEVVEEKKGEDYFSFYIIMSFIGVWLSYTNRFSISFGRIAMFFSIFVIFLLPNSIEKIKNKRIKIIIQITLFVAFVAYFVYTTVLTNYLGIAPYRFIEGTL